MSVLKKWLTVLLIISGPALADTAADVRMHFKKGQTHYALGEFEAAVDEFREAYRLRQEPAILFNLAQTYRQLHQWQHAYFHYRQYLNQKPDAPNRAEVENLIEQMKNKMDEEERLSKAEAQKAAQPAPAPPAAVPQPPPAQEPAAPAAKPTPATRYVGYAALGLSAVAGGAAFVLHGSAQSSADQFNSKYQSGNLTASDAQLRDQAQSKGKSATVAAVAGAALLAAGAVLVFAF